MEAIPVARPAAAAVPTEMPAAPDTIAPSQAAYARPGLPGERVRPEPVVAEPEVVEEEVRLTPEEEILAELGELEEPAVQEPVAEVETETAPAPPRRVTRDESGLRFGDEIRELVIDEDEEDARRNRRRRRGAPAAPARRTPAAPPRGGRRFDLDEFDEEEIEAALHGDDFLDDEDEFDDDDE